MALMTSPEQVTTPSVTAALLPIMGVVFVAFLVIGVAMPVLPLHVHDGLGSVRSWSASLPAVSSPHR